MARILALPFVVSVTLFRIAEAEFSALGHAGGASAAVPTAFLSATAIRDELRQAVSEALGAAHDLSQGRLGAVREGLRPMWRALAKNEHGRVDSRSLRYAVHRYLMKARSISVLGLEPRKQNGTDSDSEAVLLTRFAPAYVKDVLEGQGGLRNAAGFSLEDAVAMVAMIEELVKHQGREMLETVYRDKRYDVGRPLSQASFGLVLESYMIRWLMSQDVDTIRILEANRTLLEHSFEDWPVLSDYVVGIARTTKWASQQRLGKRDLHRGASSPISSSFSMEDAYAIVDEVTLSFGSFWRGECERVKSSLSLLDTSANGRVLLSDFHGTALSGEWRFSESREYLRDLGALDESTSIPRVIIPNYLQGASNCVVAYQHFRVCCSDDCESHLSEIEEAVQAPLATPEQILEVIEAMTTGLDDNIPRLTRTLRNQLHEIGGVHRGSVPLHGRLFAQWLHYVFPLDCAFPHKAGTVNSMAPFEYGDDYMASNVELVRHAALEPNASSNPASAADVGEDVDSWIEQWSLEEELLTEQIHLHAPWERRGLVSAPLIGAFGAAAALAAVLRSFLTADAGVGGGKSAFGASAADSAWNKASYV